MLFTLTNTLPPATDLGYLLHKNPANIHSATLSFGDVQVFYPEATHHRCTAALLLSINPIELVRGKPGSESRKLQDYVNDRPYVSSSFTSVAIAKVFSTALSGRSKGRQELVGAKLPLEAAFPAVPAGTSPDIFHRLFAPLGYAVEARALPLDERFPEWGDSEYFELRLKAEVTVHDLLSHIYVLLPVLDNEKHYYIADDEVDKLLRHGEGWLARHPERGLIVQRYLKRRPTLVAAAFEQLMEEGETQDKENKPEEREKSLEKPLTLHTQRLSRVAETLHSLGAKTVLDLGCGEGRLLRRMLVDKQFDRLLGMDVSFRTLEIAKSRLRLESMPERRRNRIGLIQGSLLYRDDRLKGFDAAAVVEVIEHLDAPRLAAFERVLFEFARPNAVAVTTPNREYNPLFPTLPAGQFRHPDHRFEWTRAEFQAWAGGIAARFAYRVRFESIGPIDETAGGPSQMGVFTL